MPLFGEYDIGALYKETIAFCLDGLTVQVSERNLLYAIACLSETTTGVCYDPDTKRPAMRDDLLAYVSLDKLSFCNAFARLAQLELIYLWSDRGKMVITLNEYIRSSLMLIWSNNARPALIIAKRQDVEQRPKSKRAGYVYIARAENGLHKIGRARDPEQRVRGFAGAVMPFLIELIHKIPSNDCYQAERLLHQRYQHCRRAGEWFQLTDRDVEDLLDTRRLNF